MLFYSRSFSILAGLAALCVLVFFGINVWVYDFEPLMLPLDAQALLFSLVAALLILLSLWIAIRFLDRFTSARITLRDFRRRTLLLWSLFIPAAVLSVYSLYLFFQLDLDQFLYPFSIASIVGMFVLQLITIIIWTIVSQAIDK
jgi:hypothetical protein